LLASQVFRIGADIGTHPVCQSSSTFSLAAVCAKLFHVLARCRLCQALPRSRSLPSLDWSRENGVGPSQRPLEDVGRRKHAPWTTLFARRASFYLLAKGHARHSLLSPRLHPATDLCLSSIQFRPIRPCSLVRTSRCCSSYCFPPSPQRSRAAPARPHLLSHTS
jgi:hypothetical protein